MDNKQDWPRAAEKEVVIGRGVAGHQLWSIVGVVSPGGRIGYGIRVGLVICREKVSLALGTLTGVARSEAASESKGFTGEER